MTLYYYILTGGIIIKNYIEGTHIAITGILLFYKRNQAFEQIRLRGGIPQDSVTKETDCLVVGYYRDGREEGVKSRKRLTAEKYLVKGKEIEIISGEEFLARLWNAPVIAEPEKPFENSDSQKIEG